MKRTLLCLIICCSLFYSCDPEWTVTPPYQGFWIIKNDSGQDLKLYFDMKCQNEWGDECDMNFDWELSNLDETIIMEEGSRYDGIICFEDIFTLGLEKLLTGRAFITQIDSGEILKEWVMGTDNGEHDLFDESQWEHRSWERPQSYYTIYHNAWTFTLTEADIAVAE